ncbi:MAG TPA: AAA family ATPase [Epsilonproteobacteria bacterium]|nr:AAA family ATPase [Campylobacterota bacterium]
MPFFKPTKLQLVVLFAILLVGLLLFSILRDKTDIITHEQATNLYLQGAIKKVGVDGDYLRLYTEEGIFKIYKYALDYQNLYESFPVEVYQSPWKILVLPLVVILVFLVLWLIYSYKPQKILAHSLNRSSKQEAEVLDINPITSNVRFSDIAGINDVKEELEEIIDFMRYPTKYRSLGIRLPKGVLLVGPPGVGKTMIAKAVAGEAGVPFFYQSGASFVHIYVGMGAKRVSQLFSKAKQNAPSIIFIDEIDAVGKSRGDGRNDEREATLNQLLTQMDGFEENSGVMVIGATNKIDVLDEALLRAGRFDRRIHLSLPDFVEREKTLELYLANKKHAVNTSQVAHMSVGFNFAALATLVNEAALNALREGRSVVDTEDFEAVKEKVLFGKKRFLVFNDKEREIQACYQAAKALVATWFDIEFVKIGIAFERFIEFDETLLTRTKLINYIKVHLAGSVATKHYYNEQFASAKDDISKAKNLASKYIDEFAMDDAFFADANQKEVLLQKSKVEVTSLIEKLESIHRQIVKYLLDNESITQEETREILRELF